MLNFEVCTQLRTIQIFRESLTYGNKTIVTLAVWVFHFPFKKLTTTSLSYQMKVYRSSVRHLRTNYSKQITKGNILWRIVFLANGQKFGIQI